MTMNESDCEYSAKYDVNNSLKKEKPTEIYHLLDLFDNLVAEAKEYRFRKIY